MDRVGKIREMAEGIMGSGDPAHGMEHVMSVYRLAVAIAKEEKRADMEIVQIAALCHDLGISEELADPTGKTDHASISAGIAGTILEDIGLPPEKIARVQASILSHRGGNGLYPKALEDKILFDANAMAAFDAMEAARLVADAHKGEIRRRPGDIDACVKADGKKMLGKSARMRSQTYKSVSADMFYTDTAKKMAQERVEYYKKFFHSQ